MPQAAAGVAPLVFYADLASEMITDPPAPADDSTAYANLPVISQPPSATGESRSGIASAAGASTPRGAASAALLRAPEHVLSTLESDGSRRWLRPRLAKGRYWHRRRWVGYALIALFVTLPHLRYDGRPLLLLDIPARQFILFGHTFLPTDSLLLALAMVGVLLTVVLATTLMGRVWCGWGCPQTVYMEYLFRPIDRLFEGTRGKGGNPKMPLTVPKRILRWAIYLLLSMILAHTFLSYFVGTDRLAQWMRSSPFTHPAAFLVMIGTTALVMFDFLYFREQMCLIACPYGRLQSVMLDRSSLIVGYDARRGEPRRKGKRPASGAGDCVDCHQCVVVCPTGIDIREGLQMECINCTQCIDACDAVMDRVGLPRGLIRYSSQDALEGRPSRLLRPRTVLYPLALLGLIVAFGAVLSTKYGFDAGILRAPGAPFTRTVDGRISNSMRLRLVNRSDQPQTYAVQSLTPEGVDLQVVDVEGLTLQPGETSIVPVLVRFRTSLISGTRGRVEATLQITDSEQRVRTLGYPLLGPRR